MLDKIQIFLYHHYILTYCTINISFYISAMIYRRKYFDNFTKKYKKSVEDNMIANIILAALKVSILIGVITLAVIALIPKIVDRKFVMGNHKKFHMTLSIISYLSTVIFLFFPTVAFCSIIGLFGKYDSEDIEYLYKK